MGPKFGLMCMSEGETVAELPNLGNPRSLPRMGRENGIPVLMKALRLPFFQRPPKAKRGNMTWAEAQTFYMLGESSAQIKKIFGPFLPSIGQTQQNSGLCQSTQTTLALEDALAYRVHFPSLA